MNPGYSNKQKHLPNIGLLSFTFKKELKKKKKLISTFFFKAKINFALGFANPSFSCLNISNRKRDEINKFISPRDKRRNKVGRY